MTMNTWETKRVPGDVDLFCRYAGSGEPLILLHGMPQHSLMWHAIGPILADQFMVIAPDQRGAGMSHIAASGYDGFTLAHDVARVLDAFQLNQAHVVGYDFGARAAVAFAHLFPQRVRKVVAIEFVLAAFGYEQFLAASPDWTLNLNSNWHLALLTVPDAAEWLLKGREREFLRWYFHHIAYAGNNAISAEHFETYVDELRKPGALRAMIQNYSAVWQDAKDNQAIRSNPLGAPLLVMGGEASLGPYLPQFWDGVAHQVSYRTIPKAGHWISDENCAFTASAIAEFLSEPGSDII